MDTVRTYLKTAVFTVLVPGSLAVVVPQLLAKWRPRPALPVDKTLARLVGNLSLVAGVVIYLRTAFQFGADGRGTPSPTDEPEELVTRGLYAHSRNPMYIGVLLVVLGQALRRRSGVVLWWFAGMWIGFHNRVIGYEEPHLAEKHGESYEEYGENVPRWL